MGNSSKRNTKNTKNDEREETGDENGTETKTELNASASLAGGGGGRGGKGKGHRDFRSTRPSRRVVDETEPRHRGENSIGEIVSRGEPIGRADRPWDAARVGVRRRFDYRCRSELTGARPLFRCFRRTETEGETTREGG